MLPEVINIFFFSISTYTHKQTHRKHTRTRGISEKMEKFYDIKKGDELTK